LNKLEKGLLRDYETAFCSVLALTALGKMMFKDSEMVRAALQTGMWATSIDLKNAYFHIPIRPAYRKYLRFQVLGQVY
jgi:hypothetical protein